MYVSNQIVAPNLCELDQLPFLRLDDIILQQSLSNQRTLPIKSILEHNLTSKRMQSVRNITHKYENIFAKIFTYWPICAPRSSKQQIPVYKISVLSELPIISLQNFAYLLTQMNQKQQIQKHEWNRLLSLIEHFKQNISNLIEKLMSTQYQIKLINKKNIWYNIYYSIHDSTFRIKAAFKCLNFQVSTSFLKVDKSNVQQGYIILSPSTVIEKLRQKMFEKLSTYYKRDFQQEHLTKMKAKLDKFFQRDVKKIDESLLQLKLKFNYPILRQKRFFHIEFKDGYDGTDLMQPIISNKNKYCMYGHFTGYNSNNFLRLQNTHCQHCGLEIKEMQQNKLLTYLKDNIFNPYQSSILYCAEFNRFKIIKQFIQVNKQNQTSKNHSTYTEGQSQKKIANQIQTLKIEDEDKGSENNMVEQNPIKTQVRYANYMHFCLTLKSMYPLTKARIKIEPIKQVQYVNYTFNVHNNNKKNSKYQIYKYFKPFELTDPARGKFCKHLQFADLRQFYATRKKSTTYFVNQNIYQCPICQLQLKDTQIIYLKQALVLIKYIKKLLQKVEEDQLDLSTSKQNKIDKNSVRIIINNVEKKVFIQYVLQTGNGLKKQWDEIDKIYLTLVDPYIPFSQYSLGLHRKSRALQNFYSFNGKQEESQSEIIQKQWFGAEKKDLTI